MEAIKLRLSPRVNLLAACVGFASAATCVTAPAATLYNSNGFEAPAVGTPYTSLPGVVQPPETTGDTSVADITDQQAASGDQSLRIARNLNNGVDDEWLTPIDPGADTLLTFTWGMRYEQSDDGSVIGVALTDEKSNANQNFTAGGLFIDTAFGDILYYDPAALNENPPSEYSVLGSLGAVTEDTWYEFTAIYDLETKTAFYSVGGGDFTQPIEVSGVPFYDADFTTASKINVTTRWVEDPDLEDGVAYIDDLLVTSVPEPGSLLLGGFAGVALMGRRKRS